MSKSSETLYTLPDSSRELTANYKKRASKELGEKPEQIQAHLDAFKRWLTSMPHLKCNVDDNFLLAFLRQSKFNHMKAQQRLDKFCTFRTSSVEGCPAWFEDFKARKAIYDRWIDTKCWTPLGFTQEGTLVVLIKCKNFDLNQFSMTDLQSAIQIWYDMCVTDQRIQIGGLCMIMDLTDSKNEDILKMFDPKTSRLSTKQFQECLPFRIKKIVYFNAPRIFEAMLKIVSEWLNEKMKSRMMVIRNSMDQAYEAVSGVRELMPESYGGSVKMSFEEICEKQSAVLKSMPDLGRVWAISVDETKRPKECRDLFGHYKDLSDDLMGKPGTFIK